MKLGERAAGTGPRSAFGRHRADGRREHGRSRRAHAPHSGDTALADTMSTDRRDMPMPLHVPLPCLAGDASTCAGRAPPGRRRMHRPRPDDHGLGHGQGQGHGQVGAGSGLWRECEHQTRVWRRAGRRCTARGRVSGTGDPGCV